ncbi:DMT family transporter [Aliiroseovarius subalbicans]|uniref:DMT family transporter n=1 Tax=Aliiroseovarius subalbicans TaxID=2925840 RepID=UPI001F5A9F91|nr:DMT family transporter [Aliiroseovarius subalbicans]MCI2398408.1 DMT family transporter [Aliiroseovarius subalbicans]
MTQTHISSRAWAELFLLGLIWGGVFLATRIALDDISVAHSVAHRVLWASVILWIYVLVRRLPIPRDARTWGAFLVMGLLNNILPFTLLNWSQLYVESGLVSIFNATTAVFGVLVAAAFFADERLTARKTLGVLIGFLGVAVTIGVENMLRFDPRSLAQLAAVTATLSYAFAGVWAKKRLSHLPPQVAAMGMLTGSTLIMLPAAWALDGPLPMALSLTTWAAIAYYAIVATALAYLLYYSILKKAGSGNLMLVTLLIPPVAIVLGGWLRAETLPPNAFAGLGVLALGLIVLDGRLLSRFRR